MEDQAEDLLINNLADQVLQVKDLPEELDKVHQTIQEAAAEEHLL